MSFKCIACDVAAKIILNDKELKRVVCPSCGAELNDSDAYQMYTGLLQEYRLQKARSIMRQQVNESGSFHVPPSKVDSEFSNSEWPFTLIIGREE